MDQGDGTTSCSSSVDEDSSYSSALSVASATFHVKNVLKTIKTYNFFIQAAYFAEYPSG